MVDTADAPVLSPLQLARVNLEYWQASPLYVATGAIFGDIDRLIRTDNDLIVRGWILECCQHEFELQLRLYDTVIAPLVRGDIRPDVEKSFPTVASARNTGVVFIFENCTHFDNPIQLYWRVNHPNKAVQDIALEKKPVISIHELLEV